MKKKLTDIKIEKKCKLTKPMKIKKNTNTKTEKKL